MILGETTVNPRYLFAIYKDAKNFWRWRLSHKNGKVIADGGEGYANRANAVRAAKRLQSIVVEAGMVQQGK